MLAEEMRARMDEAAADSASEQAAALRDNLATVADALSAAIAGLDIRRPPLSRAVNAEMRAATAGLPPWDGGPGVDYTHAQVAYAAATVVLYDPEMQEEEALPSADTEVLIVQRGSGDGVMGSWGGVTGYIDIMSDPTGQMEDDEFDPIDFTSRKEIIEECGVSPEMACRIDLALGERFTEPRHNGGTVHVMPLAGVYRGDRRLPIEADGSEVSAYRWVRLGDVVCRPNLSPGYVSHTLPRALASLGLSERTIQNILGTSGE